MIDPHVHLRDWEQSCKETVKHGLEVAYKAGLDAVFEMPNTNPVLTSTESIKQRIELADKAIDDLGIEIFHGIYGGVTNDVEQIREMVKTHEQFFPRMVGLKMFAGNSTGNMGIIGEDSQRIVYKTLVDANYKGVLAVHCEKESLMNHDIWMPESPFTHTQARPSVAELESVKDQIKFAKEAGFKGTLHICHISVPEALEEIEKARVNIDFKITCGLTPHHAVLYDEMMKEENGLLLKMNPPLRPKESQEYMLQALLNGRIDWAETDHAPHKLDEKTDLSFASGIPGLPYYPHFIKLLKEKGMREDTVANLTHNNQASVFGIDIPNTKREFDYGLQKEYEFDAFSKI